MSNQDRGSPFDITGDNVKPTSNDNKVEYQLFVDY